MKRHIDFLQEPNKRAKFSTLKRKCVYEQPPPKRVCMDTCLKRKAEVEHPVHKRMRTDELGALHRMLTEAYAKIEYLEAQLRDAKIREQFFLEKTNLPYNHNILCY